MAKAHFENDGSASSAGAVDDSMEQIREILFGGQVREIERHFARIEERLEHQYAALSQDLDQRLSALDGGLRRSVDALGAVLQEERAQREHEQADLGKRLAQLDADTSDGQAGLKRDLEQQLIAVQDRLETRQAELRQLLESRIEALQGDKLARDALADLLQELAGRLREPVRD
jgi:DNA repair exonuclease SbcCD ATPase subunit